MIEVLNPHRACLPCLPVLTRYPIFTTRLCNSSHSQIHCFPPFHLLIQFSRSLRCCGSIGCDACCPAGVAPFISHTCRPSIKLHYPQSARSRYIVVTSIRMPPRYVSGIARWIQPCPGKRRRCGPGTGCAAPPQVRPAAAGNWIESNG